MNERGCTLRTTDNANECNVSDRYINVVIDREIFGSSSAGMLDEESLTNEDSSGLCAWQSPPCSSSFTYYTESSASSHRHSDSSSKLSEIINGVASASLPLREVHSFCDIHSVQKGAGDVTVVSSENSSSQLNGKKKATIVHCEYCGILLKHPSKIKAHLRTHTGEKPFACNICGMRFTQRTPMRMHVRRHMGDTPFSCSWGCGKQFVSNALKNAHELKIHMGLKRQGPPRPYLKPLKCSVPVKKPYVLDERVERSVTEWNRSPCQSKDSQLTRAASRKLDEVINAVASGIRLSPPRKNVRRTALIAECQVCGLLLKHPSKIQAHMRTHTGERPFECGICGMRFSTASPVRVHLRRAHTGEKPYQCTWECGRKFVSISARNEHERVVHVGIKRFAL
ncbi:hypothetical protein AB6A40_005671 [Gnathostoma spinigerum]|uniref:C2H2-type domain-containing protein n=1 Tax=Gnathostoma spinigerum TaxID=75299 RepID=A0ABD6EQJ7_9BILA